MQLLGSLATILLLFAATAAAQLCASDCDFDEEVTVDELMLTTNIALGTAGMETCYAAEVTLDGRVAVDDITYGITYALIGCEFDGSGCREPLTPYAVSQLIIGIDPSFSLMPGATLAMSAFVLECCVYAENVGACVEWSVEPESAATIGDDGVLRISSQAAAGTVIQVTADVEHGRRRITHPVYVYTPESNPLVGYWREESQVDCSSGASVVPDDLIHELRFHADGRFSVTWYPFELYVDYWGTYTFDVSRGAIELTVEHGNHVPVNLDLTGAFHVGADGSLTLSDTWLGEYRAYPQRPPGPPNCGHVFKR